MITPLPSKNLPAYPLTKSISDKDQFSEDRRYQVFVLIWSIAALFHMAQNRVYAEGFHFALLTIASALVIARPSSIVRFLFFLCLQINVCLRVMPYSSNHELFVTLVDVTILHAFAYYALTQKSFTINKSLFFNIIAPLIRIELIILYFFVVFHKLNSDFFNVDVSCASEFVHAQASALFIPERFFLILNAYLTIGIEALIPLFLLFRKTRNIGLAIGIIFHCIIAFNPLNGFYDFSSAIFATYIVFAGKDFCLSVYRFFKGSFINKVTPIYSTSHLILIAFAFFVTLGIVYTVSKSVDDHFRYIFWAAFSFIFIVLFLKSWFSSKSTSSVSTGSLKAAHFSLLLFPAIVVLNGLCPYLGLKTESSFAMFSNLRTEGGISNHYIVPAGVQIFDFQKDLVEVTSSSDRDFEKLAERKQLIPFFQFKEMMDLHRPAQITYIHAGRKYKYSSDKPQAIQKELRQPHSFLLKKTMRFRPINKYGPEPCAH